MKIVIPVFLYIDVPSPAAAEAARQTVENLLSNGMVGMMLSQNGIQHEGILVDKPRPAPPAQARR